MAYWTNKDGISEKVAMKKIKNANTLTVEKLRMETDAMRKEMSIMAYVGEHEYILRLVGIITRQVENFCIVTEFCEHGSLENFLKEKRSKNHYMNEILSPENIYVSTDSSRRTQYIVSILLPSNIFTFH